MKYFKLQKLNRPANRQGFTLIETVVYVFILGVIIIATISFLVGMLTTLKNIKIARNINEAASVSMERMTREIRNADNLNLMSSNLGDNPSDLTIGVTEGETLVSKRFFIEDGVLKVTEDPGQTANLFPDGITAQNFTVYRASSTNSEGVKIEMSIYDNRNSSTTAKDFNSSVILRGSYAN